MGRIIGLCGIVVMLSGCGTNATVRNEPTRLAVYHELTTLRSEVWRTKAAYDSLEKVEAELEAKGKLLSYNIEQFVDEEDDLQARFSDLIARYNLLARESPWKFGRPNQLPSGERQTLPGRLYYLYDVSSPEPTREEAYRKLADMYAEILDASSKSSKPLDPKNPDEGLVRHSYWSEGCMDITVYNALVKVYPWDFSKYKELPEGAYVTLPRELDSML